MAEVRARLGRPHLIWDWNGTLLHDLHAVVAATNDALALWDVAPMTMSSYRTAFRRPVRDFLERVVGQPLNSEDARVLDGRFHDSYRQRLSSCSLAADTREAIILAEKNGFAQSILSMWHHDELGPLVAQFELPAEFVRVAGSRNDSGATKETSLRRHLVDVGAAAARTVLIGDSVDDAVAARSAGVTPILVPAGSCHELEALRESAHVADDLVAAVRLATSLVRPADAGCAAGDTAGHPRARPSPHGCRNT